MRLVFISDTHGKHKKIQIPEGDVIFHSGDATTVGEIRELYAFAQWYGDLPFRAKVFTPGNHDQECERSPSLCKSIFEDAGIIYLDNSEAVVEGLRVYGAPQQPEFCDWAFNVPRGKAIKKYWDKIPENLDVLITHGPPQGILDPAIDFYSGKLANVGCEELLKAVQRVKPKMHCFGHLHAGYGQIKIGETIFVNAACLDDSYQVKNAPIELDYCF